MAALFRDFRYAVRTLSKTPGFVVVVLLTLALGTGVNTAIFSVIDAVLLRPLSFPQADRIVQINERTGKSASGGMGQAYPNFIDLRERAKSYETFAGLIVDTATLTGTDSAARVQLRMVSSTFFDLVGARPLIGRTFAASDDRVEAPPVVVLSEGLWARKFGRDSNLVGKPIILDGKAYTVSGIVPQLGEPYHTAEAFVPLGLSGDSKMLLSRGNHTNLRTLALLRPGITRDQAEREAAAIYADLEKQYPNSNSGVGPVIIPLLERMVRPVRQGLLVLAGAVGFVLLIACVNVANLLLARSATRRREISVRTALGASRAALIRQCLAESLLLSLGGAVVGVLAAVWALDAVRGSGIQGIARLSGAKLNPEVLAFALGISILSALLFGLFPALASTRTDLVDSLRSGGRGSTDSHARNRFRSALLTAEVALGMVLLIGAGLMLRTVQQLGRVDPGFAPERLFTSNVEVSREKYKNAAQTNDFWDRALEKVRALPGVQAASATLSLPVDGSNWNSIFEATGFPTPERSKMPSSAFTPVATQYFETLGMHLKRGRWFNDADHRRKDMVAVVNESLVRRIFAGRDPIGQKIKQGWPEDKSPWREVIGVVADVKTDELNEDPRMQIFLPNGQDPASGLTLVMRAKGDPLSLAPAVEAAIRGIDSDVAVYQPRTMQQVMSSSYATQRFATTLLQVFAGIALLLAAVGIYGVTSYTVAQRTPEIGVRVALGASRANVFGMVWSRAMTPSMIGLALGAASAIALSSVLETMLYGVKATDVTTFAIVGVIFAITTTLAALIPAWRAMRVDPIEALRTE
ncbi:MAG TPA: ABC transporter permease [Bryobacteraceae bacterium]|nr:ABC transporter permease [Bryobacteraceae bacterium]